MLELMIVIAIIGIILSVVFAGYRQYESKALLQSLVYEMALAVREAQVMSTAVSAYNRTGIRNDFKTNYGVVFSRSTPTEYKISARDNSVTPPVETPVVTTSILRGNRIKRIYSCQADWNGVIDENIETDCNSRTTVKVFFTRPHFETEFYRNVNSVDISSASVLIEVGGQSSALSNRWLIIHRSGHVEIR